MTPIAETVAETVDDYIDPSTWFEDDEVLECGIENPDECESCG